MKQQDTNEVDAIVSLYKVQDENNFILQPEETIQLSNLAKYASDTSRSINPLEYCGSLNTTYDYDGVSSTDAKRIDEDMGNMSPKTGILSELPFKVP